MADGSPATLAELRGGYQIYRGKCSGCHGLFPVEEYDSQEWESGVAKMIRLKKVRLQPEEREQLLKYLSTSGAGGK
jgi:mono/diheme cytochrome c family protein